MKPGDPSAGDGPGVTRRTALKLGLAGVVGVALGAGSTAALTRLVRTSPVRYRNFSDAEAALLADICNQIIPRDDTPGAGDVGAVDYIDRQLSGPFVRHRPAYRRGLESFVRTCQHGYGRPFHDLTGDEKVAVLRSLDSGQAPADLWGDPTGKAFFELVLAHTMQGFYGSPRHGGNRHYASYRMLGLDYPQVVGQNRHPAT